MLNVNKLKGKIVEQGMTQAELAEIIGISAQNFNAKLNGRGCFSIDEASTIIDVLKIENITDIFFVRTVPNTKQNI